MFLSKHPMVQELLAMMAVPISELEETERKLCEETEIQKAEEHLEDFKKRVHRAFRSFALTHHPDVTKNDPDKTERFLAAREFNEHFQKLHLRRPEPQPIPFIVFRQSYQTHVNRYGSGSGTYTTIRFQF